VKECRKEILINPKLTQLRRFFFEHKSLKILLQSFQLHSILFEIIFLKFDIYLQIICANWHSKWYLWIRKFILWKCQNMCFALFLFNAVMYRYKSLRHYNS
jgi:hypothetical protein